RGEAMALGPGPAAAEAAAVAPAVTARLKQLVTEAATDLAEAELAVGRHDAASARLAALLAEQPLHERAAALLMDVLTAQGRQGEALAVFERLRTDLADRLGADPGSALRERHVRLLRSGPAGDERAPGAAAPSNLPEPLTSFIGREDDLARIDALLSTGRLVTVLGTGGAGKTRLAVEAARRRLGEHPDGTWVIDLASVTEPAKVGAAVITTVGLRGSALFEGSGRVRAEGGSDVDVLADQLAGHQSLLVVDNCEHLIEAVARLTTTLLVRCPGLRVLATSRERGAVDGEPLVPLGPLGLPEADADAAAARRAPAVRLFGERAAAVRPGFAVDESTVGDVVQVVRGLDGLPLALELAAARLRTLSLPELAAGLSDRFRMLTTGSRTAVPRHRTLRAVIAWSWDLLGDDERVVAERVAVLSGGITVDAASAVCAGTAVHPGALPDLLAALVDRSLLQLAPEPGRYRMLETLREYGIDRLAAVGTLDHVRVLAARHFAALVAEYDPRLRTAGQMTALRVLGAEYDNVLAALRHCCDSGDGAAALRLALDLCWYWQMFGRHADATYWLREALATPGERAPVDVDCAEAVLVLSRMGAESDMITESYEQRRARSADLGRRLARHDEIPGPAGALSAVVLLIAGHNEVAQARLDRILAGPDLWLASLGHLFRAQMAENEGDLAAVHRHVTAALDGFRRIGDRWGQATALPLRGMLRQYDGDLDGALADLSTARSLAGEFGSLGIGDEVFIDIRWADLHMRRGDVAEAEATLADARRRAERSAAPEMLILLDALEAGILVQQGELDRAEALLARSEQRLSEDDSLSITGDHTTALILSVRASLCLLRGDAARAEQALVTAYAAAVETRDMPILAIVAVVAGGLADLAGRHRDAAVLLGAAARLRGSDDRTDLQVAELTRRTVAAIGEKDFAEAYASGWALDASAALARVDPARLDGAATSQFGGMSRRNR
ncbi:ATP-binding protein, partial [Dactylosporangium fulvum]|uniref:ATP-binding protein n=1 Tax=Dactylosporangium fulvum TaxID=53359 RepID=UPI0031DB5E2D